MNVLEHYVTEIIGEPYYDDYARENIKDSVQAAWFHCSHKATVKELIEHFKSV